MTSVRPRTLGIGDRIRLRYTPRAVLVCALTALAAIVVLVLSLSTGDYPVSLGELFASLVGQGDRATDFIVLDLRMPRLLVAMGVGLALGASGAVFQSLTRNPLGSPDIIGFNWGASAAAVAAITFFGASAFATSLAAILGGALAAIVVYLLAFQRGVQGYRLILCGIGISAMLTSVVHYLLSRANLAEATQAQVWLTGTLNGRGWEQATPLWIALVVLLPILAVYGRRLNVLEMGDEAASALGVRVETTRVILIVLGVFLTGMSTAACGPIMFIALTAPQIARRLTRSTGAGITAGAIMGAFLLLLSDFVAQRVFGDTELPVGVLTAAVGGLYLAWLLAREWKAGRS
ncbi:iron chelate uptake ABC transporter family permease subunit [Sciscionella sediminilitoris]|uniref:iron chelate uptake ABC transporter family permease subunit n=1 Tax=Sciscionella sediminilitoris TaxID=1445613 RepID=UPI0004DFBF2F